MTDGNLYALERHLAEREKYDAWQEGRDAIDALVDANERIEYLEAQNRELALQIISSDGQAMDAYYAQKEAEAGLRVALKDAERIDRVWYDNYAALEANMIKVMEHVMDYSNDPHLVRFARATIAEIKGTNHDT